MDAEKLARQIVEGHTTLMAHLAGLDETWCLQPGVVGYWSVKDILAHIEVHQRRMLHWMAVRRQGQEPDLPAPYAMPEEDLAELNEQIYQENRARTLAEVRRALEESTEACRTFVLQAEEAFLFDAGRFSLPGGEPLWLAVAANTCEHDAEHWTDICAWLERKKEAGR